MDKSYDICVFSTTFLHYSFEPQHMLLFSLYRSSIYLANRLIFRDALPHFAKIFAFSLDGVKLCFVQSGEERESEKRREKTRCKVRRKDKNGERPARRWVPLNFRFKCGIEVASQTTRAGDEKLKSKRIYYVE